MPLTISIAFCFYYFSFSFSYRAFIIYNNLALKFKLFSLCKISNGFICSSDSEELCSYFFYFNIYFSFSFYSIILRNSFSQSKSFCGIWMLYFEIFLNIFYSKPWLPFRYLNRASRSSSLLTIGCRTYELKFKNSSSLFL